MVRNPRRFCYLCKQPSFGLVCRACLSVKSGRGLTKLKR